MRLIAFLVLASAFTAYAWDANEDLLSASRSGDLAAVKAAIEKGAAIETKTPYGQTPLYLAAMSGHEDVVRFLLDKGASTDVKDTFYKAPMLAFVLQRKHFEVAKLLASRASKPDEALSDVADTGRVELVQAVLDGGKPSQAAIDKAYAAALEQKRTAVSDLLKKAGAHEPPPPLAIDPAVLESYVGTYKSDQFPVELKVTVKEGKLMVQPTGAPELSFKALTPTRFAYTPFNVEIEFDSANSVTMHQAGQNIKLTKAVSK